MQWHLQVCSIGLLKKSIVTLRGLSRIQSIFILISPRLLLCMRQASIDDEPRIISQRRGTWQHSPYYFDVGSGQSAAVVVNGNPVWQL